jgi:O-methyltransferase involved in polyketide biosynthesis
MPKNKHILKGAKKMPEKIAVKLGNVQKTMLLPLWGRALETQKKEPLLTDETAVKIINTIDYDFSTITTNISEISQLGWIVRSLMIDRIIRGFLEKHPQATVVNIGSGLDTTFERVDNGLIHWYDLDLSDAIELRKEFIAENDRRKFLSGSFLEDQWLDPLKIQDNILFMAAGVFYYFDESQIRDFFKKIADKFPGSEIVFDATSPIGIKMANKMVIKNSGMDEKSYLKWGLKSAREIQNWDRRIQLLGEYLYFKNLPEDLKLKTKIGTLMSDWLKMQYLIHLKL